MSSRCSAQTLLHLINGISSNITLAAKHAAQPELPSLSCQAFQKCLASSLNPTSANMGVTRHTCLVKRVTSLVTQRAVGTQAAASNRMTVAAGLRRTAQHDAPSHLVLPIFTSTALCSRHVVTAHATSFGVVIRDLSTGLCNVETRVRDKARRMSVWVGGLAGIFGSFVGVGGGVLISPIIANACRSLPQRIISGTSLAAVMAVGTASGYVYWTNGYVDMMSVLLVASTAVLTAPLGAKATHMVDSARLRRMMGYWLYLVAPLIPLKSLIFSTLPKAEATQSPASLANQSAAAAGQRVQGSGAPQPSNASQAESAAPTSAGHGQSNGVVSIAAAQHGDAISDAQRVVNAAASTSLFNMPVRELRSSDVALAAVGSVAGFASGLLGIGGGTIVTPLLAMVTGMPQASVVGTSLAAMVFPAVVGLAQHTRLGNVDWLMAAGLVGGSFAGSFLSSQMAVHAPPMVMELAFALGMAYLGHKTLKIKTK